jgi:hypothetical protein
MTQSHGEIEGQEIVLCIYRIGHVPVMSRKKMRYISKQILTRSAYARDMSIVNCASPESICEVSMRCWHIV